MVGLLEDVSKVMTSSFRTRVTPSCWWKRSPGSSVAELTRKGPPAILSPSCRPHRSAHDISEGGLAVKLANAATRIFIAGAWRYQKIPSGLEVLKDLFREYTSRIILFANSQKRSAAEQAVECLAISLAATADYGVRRPARGGCSD
jgi:hypothetical protein